MGTSAASKLRVGDLKVLTDPWTDFSASLVFGASVTPPTQGNSTYSARYRLLNSHTVLYVVRLVLGSTFAAGSGNYTWNVPFASADASMYGACGSMWINDSGVSLRQATVFALNASTLQGIIITNGLTSPGQSANVGSSTQTWNTSDAINFSIAYEI